MVLALSLDSREMVDGIADKAVAAGGRAAKQPQDHGFMYERGFVHPDGCHWAVFWMDPAAVPSE